MKFEVVEFRTKRHCALHNAVVDELVKTMKTLDKGNGVVVTPEMFGWSKRKPQYFRSQLQQACHQRDAVTSTTVRDDGSVIICLRDKRVLGANR